MCIIFSIKCYTSGQICSETPYVHGIKNGIAIKYNPNGSIIKKTIYINGKKNGI